MRHLLTLFDLSPDELTRLIDLAAELKRAAPRGTRERLLPGRVLGLLFEKPSLRTRVSFEAAMAHVGGNSIFLGQDVGWGKRESIADFARVVSEYLDAIVFRGARQEVTLELARYASCPVINGLTDVFHPCQALADMLTLQELCGGLVGQKLAFVGDGNNVARSLAIASALAGVHFSIASPAPYAFQDEFLQRLRRSFPQAQLEVTADPRAAVAGASAVYTDVWASMGQEAEKEARRRGLAAYQVNGNLMAEAGKDAWFLHCLPAKRGEEVTDDVIDGPRSAVVQQAANRLHAQKAVLVWLLKDHA